MHRVGLDLAISLPTFPWCCHAPSITRRSCFYNPRQLIRATRVFDAVELRLECVLPDRWACRRWRVVSSVLHAGDRGRTGMHLRRLRTGTLSLRHTPLPRVFQSGSRRYRLPLASFPRSTHLGITRTLARRLRLGPGPSHPLWPHIRWQADRRTSQTGPQRGRRSGVRSVRLLRA